MESLTIDDLRFAMLVKIINRNSKIT